MGLTHLTDVGHRNLDDDEVEESIKLVFAHDEEEKTNGKMPFMTPEFLSEVIRCAGELTQFSIWALFAYIRKHVDISY